MDRNPLPAARLYLKPSSQKLRPEWQAIVDRGVIGFLRALGRYREADEKERSLSSSVLEKKP